MLHFFLTGFKLKSGVGEKSAHRFRGAGNPVLQTPITLHGPLIVQVQEDFFVFLLQLRALPQHGGGELSCSDGTHIKYLYTSYMVKCTKNLCLLIKSLTF